MKKSIYFFSLLLFAFPSFESQAQLSAGDVQVSVDYNSGRLTVSWKERSGSGGCVAYAEKEKITYNIGGSDITIFDNTTGGSAAGSSATLTTLPGNFFTNAVTVKFSSEFGNGKNASCGQPLIQSTLSYPLTTRVENPQSLTASYDVSCTNVLLNWNPPSIVASSPYLKFDISRRNANSTNVFTDIALNASSNSIYHIDFSAPPGVEQ